MDLSRLRNVDLNLLVTLQALVEERSVTLAARRLGRSQPAISAALTRLRELFGDPLLVRRGRAMHLTAAAEALCKPLAETLARMAATLEGIEGFDPSRSTREFRVLLVDYALELLGQRLAARLAKEAPGARLRLRSSYPARQEELESGEWDAWVLSTHLRNLSQPHRVVTEDSWAVVGSGKHHKHHRGPFRWRPELRFVIGDESLERAIGSAPVRSREFRRRVDASIVYDRWDVEVLRDTPFVRLVPSRLAKRLTRDRRFVILGHLAEAHSHSLTMQWPREKDTEPASRWLRELIAQEAARA